jgi:prepilin-type N-terminal cleavage/methylation domain-containing protein
MPLPSARGLAAQRGLTVLEVLIGIAIMAIVGGAISILVGSALQAKMISSVRSSDTETDDRPWSG